MPRYIDADKAFCADCNLKEECKKGEVVCDVPSMPSADVVPVVRCKDCIHCGFDDSLWWRHCTRLPGWVSVKADDFCSCGKRAAENG